MSDIFDTRVKVPAKSINVSITQTKSDDTYMQIGVYGTSRYGRVAYGFQPGIYGVDKYGEATYL